MVLKLRINRCHDDDEMEAQGWPISPVSQALNSSLLSLSVLVVFEYEEPISDISHHKKALADAVLAKNPLFSCIMKKDERGVFRWQKATVSIDEHTIVAEFPPGEESYDAWVDDYISKLALVPFDPSRPLWEFHFFNYKTSKAEATMVFKFHHALGDGISLMSTLFSIAKRVDNPELPPTFPTAKRPSVQSISSERSAIARPRFVHRLCHVIFVIWYTLVDLISILLRITGWIDDSQLPIRGPPGVEKMPVGLSCAMFRLEDIKQIKNCVGGTVNDVMTGIIFYGIQRYLQIRLSADAYGKRFQMPNDAVTKQMKNSRVTAISMINLRALTGLQDIGKMLKPDSQTPWGNRFGFLFERVPTMETLNPLEFIRRIKGNMDKHKISLGLFIIERLLRYLASLKVPRALQVCILSYTGVVALQVYAHKAYVDANILSNCFREAFEETKKMTSWTT